MKLTREMSGGTARADYGGRNVWRCAALEADSIEELIAAEAGRLLRPSLQAVINATGVILHTNLGRAPLSGAIVDAIRNAATQYSNLEYNLEAGARGKRDEHTRRIAGAPDRRGRRDRGEQLRGGGVAGAGGAGEVAAKRLCRAAS